MQCAIAVTLTTNAWLLLLYTLPSGRSSARVGIWRKLKKSGALPVNTSAHLLPNRPDLLEKFQWLAQEIRHAKGDATLAFVGEVDGIGDAGLIRRFDQVRTEDYAEIAAAAKEILGRRGDAQVEAIQAEIEKLRVRFGDVLRTDFFGCPAAATTAQLIELAAADPAAPGKVLPVLSPDHFTGKTWLTRPRPAIDRIGSAWLILRHIDAGARFVFASDPADHPDALPYDMTGVEFGHQVDDCTFETLLKRFDLKATGLAKLGEMIHDADLDDGKFQTVEAFGLDRVFKGWAASGIPDDEILARGLICFDGLHQSLTDHS